MDSQGNVVAMAITAIIVVVGAAAFITVFYQTPAPTVPISTALSETKISVNKALALGISEWAETGFDKENPVWYNNGNFPASLEEAKQDLRDTVKEEIDKVLSELQNQRGYDYEFDDPSQGVKLEFDFDDATSVDQLNKESITVKVSGFSIKDEKGDIITIKEFETEEKFEYAIWDIYGKMHEWAENDSGEISLHLQELLDSAPYQLQVCDCGAITKTTEDSIILKGSVTWEDREDPDNPGEIIQGVKSYVLEPALQDLQAKFADKPSVTCSYVAEDKAIENIPNIIKRGQAGCECAGGVGLQNNEALMGSAAAAWRTDEVGKPDLYYGVKDSDDVLRDNVSSERGFPNVESFLKVERTTPIPTLEYRNCSYFDDNPGDEALCNAGKMCFYTDQACIDAYDNAGQSHLTIQGDNEVLGMTRRIAALVRFKCEDSESRVKTELEFKKLSAEVVVRFAVLKGSEPPEFCTTEESNICIYGAAVIYGSECTPWDNCFLNPDDVEACGICECINGSQIIDPTADPVGAALFARHQGGEVFMCIDPDNPGQDPNDPACNWCESKGGVFKCPAEEEFTETTTDCQALLEETISGGKSEQCLLYMCDVENNEVKRGCKVREAPYPCDSCRKCELGYCVTDLAKEGSMCVPNPQPVGADQKCYECTLQGDCVVKQAAVGTALCSNSYGCYTYCSDDGTCTFVKPGDIGLACPTNKPDYLCNQCGIRNNKLYCGTSCEYGCCAERSMDWGRCLNPDGKCCPETQSLTDCPGST